MLFAPSGVANADDSPPVTTPGAPVGSSAAPAPAAGSGTAARAALACASQEFCVSKDTYFNGPTYKFTQANTNWSFTSYANLYNEDSSWRSRWDVPVVVYDYTQFSGAQTICVAQGWDVFYNSSASDRGSSHKWDGRPSC
ncbi:peptidase inhibitor family I36 protein [Nakamurella flava]|nr:peptidase inhibitor family I36 protein [Nakamurella flava]